MRRYLIYIVCTILIVAVIAYTIIEEMKCRDRGGVYLRNTCIDVRVLK